MNIAKKTVLITGANRGIGLALVHEALRRGVRRVYAGTRGALTIADERVIPLLLDVTSAEQIERAVEEVGSLDVLINNAGIALYDGLSDPHRSSSSWRSTSSDRSMSHARSCRC